MMTALPACAAGDHGRHVCATANAENDGNQPAAADVERPIVAGPALNGCAVSGTTGVPRGDPSEEGVLKLCPAQDAFERPIVAQLRRSAATRPVCPIAEAPVLSLGCVAPMTEAAIAASETVALTTSAALGSRAHASCAGGGGTASGRGATAATDAMSTTC